MMLEPSIDALMDKVSSKYLLVTLSAKRARDMQAAASAGSDETASRKYVGAALKEIVEGKLTCTAETEEQE